MFWHVEPFESWTSCLSVEPKEKAGSNMSKVTQGSYSTSECRTTKTPTQLSSCKLYGGILHGIYHSISGKSVLLLQSQHLKLQWKRGRAIRMSPAAVAEERQALDGTWIMLYVKTRWIALCAAFWACGYLKPREKNDEFCERTRCWKNDSTSSYSQEQHTTLKHSVRPTGYWIIWDSFTQAPFPITWHHYSTAIHQHRLKSLNVKLWELNFHSNIC